MNRSELCRSAIARPSHEAEAERIGAKIMHAPRASGEQVDACHSSGQPLNASARAFMEPFFAHDFSRVRVHTDDKAAESVRSVGAKAYTLGRDIVFGAGQYRPHVPEGRGLLAHELTHVVQQSRGGAQPMLMRAPLDDSNESGPCGSERTCATSNCEVPDPGHEGNGETATSWSLKVLIDTEAKRPSDVTGSNVGHAYVELSDSTKRAYTYGFYPKVRLPVAAGCMVHPDRSHEPCVDHEEQFNLQESDYQKALTAAQKLCESPPIYDVLSRNCTTFAQFVVNKAGRSMPSAIGGVGPMELVPAENPNTLHDAIKRRDTFPTYNLTVDTEIREAIAKADPMRIAETPGDEKVRIVNRLLEGWLSDDDIDAIEKIYANTPAHERPALKSVVKGWLPSLNSDTQKTRLSKMIGGV